VPKFCFLAPTDRFVEIDWAMGRFGAPVPNTGFWSIPVLDI
jgi:hypothetical protein